MPQEKQCKIVTKEKGKWSIEKTLQKNQLWETDKDSVNKKKKNLKNWVRKIQGVEFGKKKNEKSLILLLGWNKNLFPTHSSILSSKIFDKMPLGQNLLLDDKSTFGRKIVATGKQKHI